MNDIKFDVYDRYTYTEWMDYEIDNRKIFHEVFDKETNETHFLDVSPYVSLTKETVKKIIALNFPTRKSINSFAPLHTEDIDRLYSEMND
jgi:hypothetical protein